MSSKKDQVADLLKTGDAYLTDLINRQNGTSFTPGQLVIGRPTVSADDVYNTDIEITFPPVPVAGEAEPEAPMGELHYPRFDLGRLFAHKNVRIRDRGYTTHRDLAEALVEEVRLRFEPEDLVAAEIPEGPYPKTLLIRADELSLRFIGQFSIDLLEPIVEDTSIITEVTTESNVSPAPMALKADGTLFHGIGNAGGGMIKASNGEIEIAAAARLVKVTTVFAPSNGTYFLNVADNADWSIPHSFALVDNRNGDHITDLYDCTFKVTALESNGVLEFNLRRLFGHLAMVDDANDLRIQDEGTSNEDQTLYQDIQRVSFYKGKLGSLSVNELGAPYGDFRVELRAQRRDMSAPPVELSFDVKVEGLAAE